MDIEFLTKIESEYSDMTKTFKKVADYILKDYLQIPFMSVQEVGESADVSPATIHRFCISLGFSGFSSFQKEIQLYMQKNLNETENETYKNWSDSGESILKNQIEINLKVLNEMYTDDLEKNFDKAAHMLASAKKIYILGLRQSHGSAVWLHQLLKGYMDNIVLLTIGVDDIYDSIISVGPDDVLFAIGFKAYIKYTVDIIKLFSKVGAKTIALTDKYTSPLAQYADVSLIPGNSTPSYGFVMATTIVKALSVATINLLSPELIERQNKVNDFLVKKDIYI